MVTIKEFWDYVGGLSKPSKMPCHGWSISAFRCITGSRLAAVTGSVCSGCYARKGRYVFSNVQDAHARRLDAYLTRPHWVSAMARLINHYEGRPGRSGFFRWFDSGDLQDVGMLARIASVAEETPDVRHWLPTKEYGIVHAYMQQRGFVPGNLTIRVSAPMVGAVLRQYDHPEIVTSSVSAEGGTCPAYADGHGGTCGDCRACWDRSVPNVVYPLH